MPGSKLLAIQQMFPLLQAMMSEAATVELALGPIIAVLDTAHSHTLDIPTVALTVRIYGH